MATIEQPGGPDDLTLDLRVAERAGRSPITSLPGLPGAEPHRPMPADSRMRRVSGKIYDRRGAAMSGLDIVVCHVGFGCEAEQLGVTTTGPDGAYSLEYQRDGVVNLQIRAVGTAGKQAPLSRAKHRAATNEIINLVCPADVRQRAPEHARLMDDLAPHLGRASLAEARESGDCRDITLLSRSTGWDGRLVAIAAHAERLAAQTHAPASALYALLRLGLPTDPGLLANLRPETLDLVFKRANQSGVAGLNQDEIASAKSALASYAREQRLNNIAAPGTLSTVGELLASSGLDREEASRFEQLTTAHRGAALWKKAIEAGIPKEKVAALREQGKLARLTLNNAPLISALQHDIGREPIGRAMVSRDLHTPQAWQSLLTRAGAGVPPAYRGQTEHERMTAYAEDLARKVRVSLPTHVVARRAEAGEFQLPGAGDAAQVLYRAADELNFRFGTTPTRTFLKHNQHLLNGVRDPQATERALITMHRVYQMTPGDEAMKVLINEGLTSAYLITSMDQGTFSQQYAAKMGGPNFADKVFHQAQLISSVVYNAFAAAQTLASTPVVYAVSPPADVAQQAQQNIIRNFPTMERLFGELDFCECDHCRSVLSPAAYLVDLLSFVDPPDSVWELIRQNPAEPKPFQVLTKRRPDLPLLPLTCENTHTVLPYIDIVNEILEFSVAHENSDLPAFDVGLAESDDLLAEPQNLIAEAYPALRDATYPLGLPFDLWLETVRGFLDRLDAPLAKLLDLFCPVTTLDGLPYGRRTVHREELGLSPAEHTLFTNGTTDWHKLYGYPDAATARTELTKAKTLARRLGVSYRDLAELVKTWFVNPALDALILLRSLGLDAWELMRYMNAAGVPPFDAAERQAFEQKAGGHLTWITSSYTAGAFDRIVVLADSDTSCSFEHTTIRYLKSADPLDEVLTRLNLLVRLRRKTGWKLSEVDAALHAFLPAGTLGPALNTALVHLAHLKTLAEQVKVGSDTRIALLSLWSTMDRGRYRRLFLSPRMRAQDRAIFDDPYGNYLSNPAILLKNHLPAVQGALNLTADEIKAILGAGLDSTTLSLATVSLLDRHRVLAKGLKHSVPEIIALAQLSGTNPFASTSDALTFVATAGTVKRAGLRVTQLDYLIRDSYDPAGPLAPRRAKVLALIRSLATEIDRIRAEHAIPADGLAFTDEVLGQKLPLVLPPDISARFLSMWAGTTQADQAFFNANLMAPVGFAGSGDYALLFPPPPAAGPEAQETWHRNRRAHLAGLFLPFLQDRLIQTGVRAALSGEFDADPELMAALIDELLALNGSALMPAFMAANTDGFTVTYLDGSGAVLSTLRSATGYAAAGPAGTASIRLSGVFEVPTPGPYAFAAPTGSVLALSHLTDPLTAGSGGGFFPIPLEAGKLYELTVSIPGAGPAQLKVTAENLPAGAAGRLTVRPSATVDRIAAAHELIRKALLIAGELSLGLAELRHFEERSADFAGWDLSVPAFAPMMRVLATVLLRDELRADGSEIIGIFREARRTPAASETAAEVREDVLRRIATLTRRPLETVVAAADTLGFNAATDFADERATVRLWRLLSLAKTLGVAPSSVKAWAEPGPGEALAADVRTTLKARFEPSAWRATVRPISDRLRQLRRDALVQYLMDRDDFESLEQLFEHFLIDPGTEPVVQTSRLRLAISSMQTFIQRCLMNLELEVRPAVLSSTQWEWMKRYRVWEANRKIFLWPENWLEPEFRDDKTHLFQALEGELLQGDVSQDLAEDAFHGYLSGLDKIARLEIVSTWLQEHEIDPGNNILHVIGRTFNKPNEYFYRRYLSGEWTPWEPVAAQIEGDHMVVTVWRGRPYLFWLTFLIRADEPEGAINFTDASPTRIIDIGVSWAEYQNGQWSVPESSDLKQPLSAAVPKNFDPRNVFVHATTHLTAEEDQVRICLSTGGAKHVPAQQGSGTSSPVAIIGVTDAPSDGSLYRGFRLVGRNAAVEIVEGSDPLSPPFTWTGVAGTRYLGNGPLTVWHTSKITVTENKTIENKSPKQVLAKGDQYSLVIPPRPVNTTGSPEIDSLVRPFFYQDGKHTFFVEPTVTESVFHEWEEWIVTEPTGPGLQIEDHIYWEEFQPPIPVGPITGPDGGDPVPPEPISPYALYELQDTLAIDDAILVREATIQYEESFIGALGAIHG